MPIKPVCTRTSRRRLNFWPVVATLEGRALLAPVNVLVNNPAEDDTSTRDTQSESSVLAYTNAAGQQIVIDVFNDSYSNVQSSNKFTGYSRSTDGGATFTDIGTLPTNPNGDAGDPVLTRDAVSGRIYLSTLSFAGNPIDVFRSDDDGQTFQVPVNAAPGRSSTDKEWITVDNAPGAGQGTVYLVVRDFGSGNGIYLFRSTDGGNTFGPNGGVLIASGGAHNVQGANVVVGPDHAVYAAYFDQSSPEAIRVRKSTDGGQTFDPAVTISTLELTSTNGDQGLSPGFRSDAFPQLATNPNDPNIVYAVYPDRVAARNDKGDIFFSESTDGGATWGPRVRVNDDAGNHDQYMPTLAVTPDGSEVGVFWYDRRNDPANNLIDYFGAIGTISGTDVTFGPNYRVSDVSFAPFFGRDPVVNPVYMGDYDQMAADNNFFYLSHVDTRLSSPGNRQDVRLVKVSTAAVGPEVIAVFPSGNIPPGLSGVRVTFNEPIDLSTIDPSDFAVTDQDGNPVPIAAVTPVDGSSDTQFDVSFNPLGTIGTYTITVGPGSIADLQGNLIDNNLNGIGGEAPDDRFVSTFTIVGPKIIASSPTGVAGAPVDHISVTFNEPMDPSTFDPNDPNTVVLTGPNGPITVTGVTSVGGSNNMSFNIAFDPQSAPGIYQVVIGPHIRDFFGNEMDQDGNGIPGEIPGDQFRFNFSIFQVVNYQAAAEPQGFVELAGDPNAFTIITSADDSSVPVDLGSNTFTFYNGTYTGNNQLFASSNGLITFGSSNSSFSNTNLTTTPSQAAIAPLWSDWIGSNVNNASNPMVLGEFTTFNGAPALVVEWNQIWHYPSSPQTVSFEAILMLNTGTTQGDIYFEYANLDTGDFNRNGATATVGIKDSGNQPLTGGNLLLINYNNGTNPLVQSGTAIHISVASTGPDVEAQFGDPFAAPVQDPPKPVLPEYDEGDDEGSDGGAVGGNAPLVAPPDAGSRSVPGGWVLSTSQPLSVAGSGAEARRGLVSQGVPSDGTARGALIDLVLGVVATEAPESSFGLARPGRRRGTGLSTSA